MKPLILWKEEDILVRSPHELDRLPSLNGYHVCVVDILANTSLLPEILAAKPKLLVVTRVDDARAAYDDLGKNTWVIGDIDKRPDFVSVKTKSSNSPYRFQKDNTVAQLAGRNVVCATNNGTKNMYLALEKHADAVYAVSFRNMTAVKDLLRRLKEQKPDRKLLLLASGEIQLGILPPDRDEDRVFAEYFRRVLLGEATEEDGNICYEQIRDISYTEYAKLDAKNGIPKEQIEGDYVFVTTADTTDAVPQAIPIAGKNYLCIKNAKRD